MLFDDLTDRNNHDKYIYHYTRYDKAIEYILDENKLRFNTLSKTNDPLEFMPYCKFVSSNRDLSGDERIQAHKLLTPVVEIIKQGTYISCFCVDFDRSELSDNERSDNNLRIIHKGYCRSRMWSQYGQDHKGVCLIFNKEKLLNIAKYTGEQVYHKKIVYDNTLPDIEQACTLNVDTENNIDPMDKFEKHINTYLFTKSEDYKDEHEYRIALVTNIKNEPILINYQSSLEGLILGVSFPKCYELNIRSEMNKRDLHWFKMRWFNGKPDLDQMS